MTRTRAIVVAIVALLAVGGVGIWFAFDQVLSGDSVPALTLPTSAPSATADAGAATADPAASSDPAATAAATATAAAPGGAVTAESLAGDWTIVTDASTAGYRVRERLAQLSADSDAVGRSTTGVTGTATLTLSGDKLQVTAATIGVDTTTIASDRSQRDNRMRNEGLQTDSFPTATFTLTAPVDVPADALTGTVVGRDPPRRPDAPRRDQERRHPGQGAALNGQIQVAGLDHVPAERLLDHRARTSAGSSSRSPTRARSSSWSTSRRASAVAGGRTPPRLLRVDAARIELLADQPQLLGGRRRASRRGPAATATSQPIVSRTSSTVAPGWSESSRISPVVVEVVDAEVGDDDARAAAEPAALAPDPLGLLGAAEVARATSGSRSSRRSCACSGA